MNFDSKNLRNSLALLGVTALWHVAQWVSRTPPHHTLPAFVNFNGSYVKTGSIDWNIQNDMVCQLCSFRFRFFRFQFGVRQFFVTPIIYEKSSVKYFDLLKQSCKTKSTTSFHSRWIFGLELGFWISKHFFNC